MLALPAFLPSVISSFLIQNKGGPPGSSPRSATALYVFSIRGRCRDSVTFLSTSNNLTLPNSKRDGTSF